jgi:hypothetical protein
MRNKSLVNQRERREEGRRKGGRESNLQIFFSGVWQ